MFSGSSLSPTVPSGYRQRIPAGRLAAPPFQRSSSDCARRFASVTFSLCFTARKPGGNMRMTDRIPTRNTTMVTSTSTSEVPRLSPT